MFNFPFNDDGIHYRRTNNLFVYNELVVQFESTNQFEEFIAMRIIPPRLRYLYYPPSLCVAILNHFKVIDDSLSAWQDSEELFKIVSDWVKENVE